MFKKNKNETPEERNERIARFNRRINTCTIAVCNVIILSTVAYVAYQVGINSARREMLIELGKEAEKQLREHYVE